MTTTPLYSLRTDGPDFRITKFVDGEVESSYRTSQAACECPAGHRHTCRHRQMLPQMLAAGIINTHWFWNYDWHRVVDFSGELKSNLDALNELANIPGVQVLDLNDPAGMHNAIAEAVGEPESTIADLPPTHSAHSGDTIGRITLSAPKAWRRL